MKGLILRTAVVVHDLVVVAFAWYIVYLVRYNFHLEEFAVQSFLNSLPFVWLGQGVVLWWTGLYRSLWRFASIPDLWNISRASLIGMLAVSLILFLFNRLEGVPRSSLLLFPIFLVFLLGGPRIVYRLWKDHGFTARNTRVRKRVLLLGAGRAGEMLARDMHRDGEYVAVGFLDDKPRLKGAKIYGLPVFGCVDQLPEIVKQIDVDFIVIAIPSATNTQMIRIVDLCERAGIKFRILPRLVDVASATSSVMRALREVALEDFLGRESVKLDWMQLSKDLAGKTIMITGGGGSIGGELARQIARLAPQTIVLFERSEFNLYNAELELRREFPELDLRCFLGDICDEPAVDYVVSTYRPDIIFHAAAYKHVPMLQHQPREAVRNNIAGTRNMVDAADRHGVSTFVMISSDKAVNPANVMGATKRVAEMLCQAMDQRSKTRYITVRFGNVLGSAGSVVPLFQKQIEAGGPVTVTHPEVTRYFMTIPEACQLIMQASVMGRGGEVFVLDMGQPIKIAYLAEQMIRLAGKVPGKDVELKYTGLRPGEKLFEELFYHQEKLSETAHEKIMQADSAPVDWTWLRQGLVELENASAGYDEASVTRALQSLVPEMSAGKEKPDSNILEFKRANA